MKQRTWQPEEPEKIRGWFDGIARRYDLINAWLSLGLDASWRRRSRDLVWEKRQKSFLDLGAGTGKWTADFLEKGPWDFAVGLDFSREMLRLASQKYGREVRWVNADFHRLPFEPGTFDLVLSAFALRSVTDLRGFFKEVHAVLRGSGKAAFLCLTRPTSVVGKIFYYLYVRFYLTLVGSWISGSRDAYRFLSESVLNFREPEETAELMEAAGFRKVSIHRLTQGIATLIVGSKS